jgi:hypothetical protein
MSATASSSISTFCRTCGEQGCQMTCFQTKNPNLGKFWRDLQWTILVYFMAIWSILQLFSIFVEIWYIFPVLVCKLYQEKSDNPGGEKEFLDCEALFSE